MKNKTFFYILFIFFFSVYQLNAQVYTHKAFYTSIFAGEYKKAAKILSHLKKASPNNVKTRLAYADFYYLMYETSGDREVYNILCKKNADFINKTLSVKGKLSSDEIFYLISAKAIILKIEFKKKRFLKVAKEFQSLIKYFKYAKEHETHPKLKLISGMYNYYIETAKDDYPVAYPVLIFFPSGNKNKGLNLLKECSRSNNEFISTRAKLFLANIYRADEKNFEKAQFYFQELLKNHPNNVHWRKEYIFTLRKYNRLKEAELQKSLLLKTIKNSRQLINDQIIFLKKI